MGRGALHEPVNPGNSGAAWVTEGDDFVVSIVYGGFTVTFMTVLISGFVHYC